MKTQFINFAVHPSQYAALLLRVTLGSVLIAHGLLKPLVFTMAGTVQFFESVGFPGFLAYVTVVIELVAGTLLILGYRTREASLAAVPVLLGAASVHIPNGWVFSAPNGGWEYPVFLAIAAIVQSLLGDGVYALGNRTRPTTIEDSVTASRDPALAARKPTHAS